MGSFDVSIFTCLLQIYFSTRLKRTKNLYLMWKLIHAAVMSWSTRRRRTIDLLLTYDADIIAAIRKANVRPLHDNCKTRFLRASHVTNGNPSPNKTVRDIYDWYVKRPFVSRCTLNHFNTDLTLRSATGATTGEIRSTRTFTKHVGPVLTKTLVEINMDKSTLYS